MPSPFPGMDPYLEGHLWPDFYQGFATAIQAFLTPKLRPNYVARLAVRMIQDPNPEAEVRIMYPDVEVLARKSPPSPIPTTDNGGVTTAAPPISPALSVPMLKLNYEVRLVNVEIRDAKTNQLITSIEILSPVNKRGPYLRQYRQKRERLAAAGVHILDWPLLVTERLPVVAVPLREPDADLALDLPTCFGRVYENAAYDLSIDYTEVPPPPLFDAETAQWIDNLLRDYRTSTADG